MSRWTRVPCIIGVCSVAVVFGWQLLAADPKPVFDIRSEDGTVIISADQIQSYDWSNHTITLVPKVRESLFEKLNKDRPIVAGVPFVVSVSGKEIYRGHFTSSLSSKSFSTPVILVDGEALAGLFKTEKLGADQIRIQPAYPSYKFFKGPDVRGDITIKTALTESNKITHLPDPHIEWVSNSLLEMKSVDVGMTRAALLKVFQEEGGLSNRLHRRFAYRDCPYMKVDVEFEAVGNTDDNLDEAPKDKIKKISQPFLEWSIED